MDIPRIGGSITSGTVDSLILNLFPDFIHYLIAFFLLANFWWAHHLRSHFLRGINRPIIFLNILTLLFVGLIPFSTNLIGDFPLNDHAALVFELNLFLLGLLSVLQWRRVIRSGYCLKDGIGTERLRTAKEDSYIFPILSFIAIALSLLSVPWSAFIYLIAPVYVLGVQRLATRPVRRSLRAG